MNFDEVLAHHLLDHPVLGLGKVGGVQLAVTKHVIMMWIVGAVILTAAAFAARSATRAGLLLRSALEAVILFIQDDIVEPVFHHASDRYLPYFLTLFFFIFLANLAGLVPYGSTATGNISVTAGLALCTFGMIQIAGIREQGLVSYVKHIVPSGLPVWLVPLLFLIEILGLFAKCFALCIRLFANMIAGHIVALGFLSLIFIFGAANHWFGLAVAPASVGLALFVNLLDILVALLQAYIFTMLTVQFVGMAVHPH